MFSSFSTEYSDIWNNNKKSNNKKYNINTKINKNNIIYSNELVKDIKILKRCNSLESIDYNINRINNEIMIHRNNMNRNSNVYSLEYIGWNFALSGRDIKNIAKFVVGFLRKAIEKLIAFFQFIGKKISEFFSKIFAKKAKETKSKCDEMKKDKNDVDSSNPILNESVEFYELTEKTAKMLFKNDELYENFQGTITRGDVEKTLHALRGYIESSGSDKTINDLLNKDLFTGIFRDDYGINDRRTFDNVGHLDLLDQLANDEEIKNDIRIPSRHEGLLGINTANITRKPIHEHLMMSDPLNPESSIFYPLIKYSDNIVRDSRKEENLVKEMCHVLMNFYKGLEIQKFGTNTKESDKEVPYGTQSKEDEYEFKTTVNKAIAFLMWYSTNVSKYIDLKIKVLNDITKLFNDYIILWTKAKQESVNQ